MQSAEITSPPAIEPRARQVSGLTLFFMNFTLPSANSDVHSARVVAAGGERRIGRAAVVLVDADPVERPAEAGGGHVGVRGHRGRHARVVDAAVGPARVAELLAELARVRAGG